METNASSKTLDLIELLEYIFDTHQKTGNKLPIKYLQATISDLKRIIINSNQTNKNQLNSDFQGPSETPKSTQDKKSGLPGRIKPMPPEVRGRVRELVDLISDENSFDDALDSN